MDSDSDCLNTVESGWWSVEERGARSGQCCLLRVWGEDWISATYDEVLTVVNV